MRCDGGRDTATSTRMVRITQKWHLREYDLVWWCNRQGAEMLARTAKISGLRDSVPLPSFQGAWAKVRLVRLCAARVYSRNVGFHFLIQIGF